MSNREAFEKLLFEGTLAAFRLLSLEELQENLSNLLELELPVELGEFPMSILTAAIAEKQAQRALN
jgi:hypothetical protein